MLNTALLHQEAGFTFGTFELIPRRRLLSRDGKPVKIGSRALDVLIVLVENAGNVIAKDELILRVWGSVVVEDTNLRVQISALRRLLGDDGLESRYIVHAARRGYIFVAELDRSDNHRSAYTAAPTSARAGLHTSTSHGACTIQ